MAPMSAFFGSLSIDFIFHYTKLCKQCVKRCAKIRKLRIGASDSRYYNDIIAFYQPVLHKTVGFSESASYSVAAYSFSYLSAYSYAETIDIQSVFTAVYGNKRSYRAASGMIQPSKVFILLY